MKGRRLVHVHGLAFGKALFDVEKNDFFGEFHANHRLGTRSTYISCAYNGNFHQFGVLKKGRRSDPSKVVRKRVDLGVDSGVARVFLDEFAAWRNVIAHQHREDAVGLGSVVNGHLLQRTRFGIQRGFPKLL